MTLLRHNVSCSLFEQDLLVSELTSSIVKELVYRNPRINMRGVRGPKRDRTADLLLARQALSQLSYGPI